MEKENKNIKQQEPEQNKTLLATLFILGALISILASLHLIVTSYIDLIIMVIGLFMVYYSNKTLKWTRN